MSRTFVTDDDLQIRINYFNFFSKVILYVIAAVIAILVSTAGAAAEAIVPTGLTYSIMETILWAALGVAAAGLVVLLYKHYSVEGLFGSGHNGKSPEVQPTRPWVEFEDETPKTLTILDAPTRPAPPMPVCRPARAVDLPEPDIMTGDPLINGVASSNRDDLGIFFFTSAMKASMSRSRVDRGRDGWWNNSIVTVEELNVHLRLTMRKGDLVEIANACMMLHQRGEKNVNA